MSAILTGTEYFQWAGTPYATMQDATWSAWVRPTDLSADIGVISLNRNGSSSNYERFTIEGGTALDPIEIIRRTAAGAKSDNGGSITINVWNHMLCRMIGSTGLEGWINGVKVAETTYGSSVNALVMDVTTFGALFASGTPSAQFIGNLAECAIWTSLVTDPQIALLTGGRYPHLVGTAPNIYKSFSGALDSANDVNTSFTNVGGATFSAGVHPTMSTGESGSPISIVKTILPSVQV